MLRVILTVGLTQTNLSASASTIAYKGLVFVLDIYTQLFDSVLEFVVFRYGNEYEHKYKNNKTSIAE